MSDPVWAKGIALEFLKECAGIFKADIKPHCYGAFGLPKERDIADAHAAGELVWTRENGRIVGVAIFRRMRSPSRHSDFAGREAQIRKGELLIRYLAGTPAARLKLLRHLIANSGPIVWAEAHVEDGALIAQLEGEGFAWQMTKVAASSDLKGLYARGLPAGRFPSPMRAHDAAALAVLCPDFIDEDQRAAMLAEAKHFAQWAQHYSGYNKRHSWTAFALRGYDASDPAFIIKPAEMSKQWKAENPDRMAAECADTIAAVHFPATMATVARLPGAAQRARLMRLSAKGGELTRHADITDPEAGTMDGCVARLHIPLISPDECLFRGWGLDGREHRIHFPERSLCYLDTRKPHAVINPGAADRVHLVVDCFANEKMRRLIASASL